MDPGSDDWNDAVPGITLSDENVPPRAEPEAVPSADLGERERMVLWPAVSLIGFLVLTAVVIAMGTRSTARYEREQRAASVAATAAEPVGATSA